MNETDRGPFPSPQMASNDDSLLSLKTHKFTDFDVFSPKHCEFCGRRITNHDHSEAPYADGKYLCNACRGEYMDLHHTDPFRVINPLEEGTS